MPDTAPEAKLDFFDPEVNDCPYHAYRHLRDEQPVWRDPRTGMYWLTRYEDVRAALLDTARFSNAVGNGANQSEKAVALDDPDLSPEAKAEMELQAELAAMYERDGWTPVPTLTSLDDPHHRTIRRLYDEAFRPERIEGLTPYIEDLCDRLIDDFVAAGECDFVAAFAVPLPLYVIGRQVGLPEADMQMVKRWTDAWARRMGLMLEPDERRWSAAQEIEAQQYLKERYEDVRREPDDTLLSELVNRTVEEWGRKLDDAELHSEMMADMLVGGAETTTSALAAAVRILIEQPEVAETVRADPDTYLEPFIEEVLRIESPVQGLLREAAVDLELHGTTIPAGSTVCIRYGAANRDERRYQDPTVVDLERPRSRSHLAFGVGTHHCLGAPLARRELHYGLTAVLRRLDHLRLKTDANDFAIADNFFLRQLRSLWIQFEGA